MAEVRLREAADADIAAILDYSIEAFGEDVGTEYVRGFERAFDLLRRHPGAGALYTEVQPPIHCLHHRRHRIFYDVKGDIVWVARILHHSQDTRLLLDE